MKSIGIIINNTEVARELSKQVVAEYENGLDRKAALKKVVLAYQNSIEQNK